MFQGHFGGGRGQYQAPNRASLTQQQTIRPQKPIIQGQKQSLSSPVSRTIPPKTTLKVLLPKPPPHRYVQKSLKFSYQCATRRLVRTPFCQHGNRSQRTPESFKYRTSPSQAMNIDYSSFISSVVNFVPILIFFCLFLYLLSVLSFYLFCVYILLLLARVQGGQTSCTLWGHTIMRDPWTIPPCSWAIIFLSSKFSYFISFCREFGYLLNFFPLRTAHKYNAYMV